MTPRRVAPIASLGTTVPVSRSVDAIRALVERFAVREFRIVYATEAGRPIAVRFAIVDPSLLRGGAMDTADAALTAELYVPSDMLFRRINGGRKVNRAENATRDRQQAERIAWRQLHDIVRASLIGVESGIVTLGEAFFANLIVTDKTGREGRMADVLLSGHLLSHGHGRLTLGKADGEAADV